MLNLIKPLLQVHPGTLADRLAGLLLLSMALVFLLLPHNSHALDISIDPGFRTQVAGTGVEYLQANLPTSSIQQVINATDWQTVAGRQASFGFDQHPYWLRFYLTNTSLADRHLLIEISNSYLDRIDLYIVDEFGAVVEHQQSGEQRSIGVRPIKHAKYLHPIKLPENTRFTVIVRVQSDSSLSIPIYLWDHSSFITQDFQRTAGMGIFFGLLIILSLYHLLIAALTKDSSSFFFSLFTLSSLVIFTHREGVPASLLAEGNLPSAEAVNILANGLSSFAFCLFTLGILRVAQTHPTLARLLRAAAFTALVPVLAYLMLSYSLAIRLMLGYVLVVIGLYILVLWQRVRQGYPPARRMIIGTLFGATGSGTAILIALNLIPQTQITQGIIYTCFATMVLFFALTLSYRINMDRLLKEEAQRKHTHELDELVRIRTAQLEETHDQLRIVSITDGLTGLYNRRHFDTTLTKEFHRAYRDKTSLAILLMDVDHFKKLNDDYGHAFGDLCLKEVADAIQANIRRPLDTAARYGGEEFVILLPDTDLAGALHIAETIRQTISGSEFTDGKVSSGVTASIGVAAEIPSLYDAQEALLKSADDRLYQAKHRGRNRVSAGEPVNQG